ncbi:MAG: hypothetical protein QW057_09390 [Candidatus Bathyarchaeia archaeon]
MVEVAQAAAKARNSRLRLFYLKVKKRRGYKVAIVALARELLGVIHHILVEGEDYVEEGLVKRAGRLGKAATGLSAEETAHLLRRAGYLVKEPVE